MDQAADMRAHPQEGVTIIWVEHIMGVLMRVVDRCIVLDRREDRGGPAARSGRRPRVIEVYLGTDAAAVQAARVADARRKGRGKRKR
jgi:branched-chain amino acid transport system ATP-binding protein